MQRLVRSLGAWAHAERWQLALAAACVAAFCAQWYWFCALDLEMWNYQAEQATDQRWTQHSAAALAEARARLRVRQAALAAESELRDSGREWAERQERSAAVLSQAAAATRQAADERIVLACITRDDFYGLEVNRAQLEELGSRFADYRIIVVENDSTAAFRRALFDWAIVNPRVTIISKTFGLLKRPTLRFLAKMRNLYVEELRKPAYDGFDRVFMFDMDVSHRWPVDAIVGSALQTPPDFGVRCFHVYNDNGGHRDVLAFRAPDALEEFVYAREPYEVSVKTLHDVYRITGAWFEHKRSVQVESCFGGLAVYSRQVLLSCGYDEELEQCEHLSLNKCIAQQGKTLVLDTSVAVPFHYRRVVDGLLLLLIFSPCLPLMLAAAALGIGRNMLSRFYLRGQRLGTFAELVSLLVPGVVSQFWFVAFAKDNDSAGLVPLYAAALGMELLTTELASGLLSASAGGALGGARRPRKHSV